MAKTATVSSVIPEETTKYLLLFFRKEKRTLNELERNPHENVRVVDRKKAANNLLLLDDILEHFSCHLFIVSYGSYLKLGSRVISIEFFFFYLVWRWSTHFSCRSRKFSFLFSRYASLLCSVCVCVFFFSVNRDDLVDVRVYSFVNVLFDICRKANFDASISRTYSLRLEFDWMKIELKDDFPLMKHLQILSCVLVRE